MRNILLTISAPGLLMSSQVELAGYLDFSTNWDAPNTKSMTKRAAANVLMKCKKISTHSNFSGRTSGAMVVAETHETYTDKNTYLTVRLYKNNVHEKSCHVYTGKNLDYSSCNCECVD